MRIHQYFQTFFLLKVWYGGIKYEDLIYIHLCKYWFRQKSYFFIENFHQLLTYLLSKFNI